MPLSLVVRFPQSWNQDMSNQTPEGGRSDLREGGTSRGLMWLGVSAGILVTGILLYTALGPDKEGEKLRKFCDKALVGEPMEEVAEKARDFGFDARELQDTLLIAVAGKRLGQSCFLMVVEGNVSEIHSVVTH